MPPWTRSFFKRCSLIAAGTAASLLMQCSQLPQLRTAPAEQYAGMDKICSSPFLSRSWRFIHSIEATMPTGAKANLIGVTVARPATRFIHCVLMTLEGLVVFEAKGGDRLSMEKALPPLDNPAMAKGLMEDISLVFFRPAGECMGKGVLGDAVACRYKNKDGLVEVKVGRAGGWEIRSYNSSKRIVREILAENVNVDGIAGTIKLRAPGILGYSLILTLIEAEKLP